MLLHLPCLFKDQTFHDSLSGQWDSTRYKNTNAQMISQLDQT